MVQVVVKHLDIHSVLLQEYTLGQTAGSETQWVDVLYRLLYDLVEPATSVVISTALLKLCLGPCKLNFIILWKLLIANMNIIFTVYYINIYVSQPLP
jgi:hypothetical protein